MNQEELERFAQEFEAQQSKTEQPIENHIETETIPAIKTETTGIVDLSASASVGFTSVVGGVKQNILNKAKEKISDEKSVDRHAENLKNIANKALEVEAEQASLQVKEQEADNKVRKQEIKNKLIVLKAEAQRLKKEQEQLNREQKEDHKRRNKEAKWELYKDKLTKMKYSYVPNAFVLTMLLFFDGMQSFFDGLGTVSTSIVKALKWVFLIGAIFIALLSVSFTRQWIINLFSGG